MAVYSVAISLILCVACTDLLSEENVQFEYSDEVPSEP